MELRNYFPFPTIRPLQEEAMKRIDAAYEAGKSMVILEAPTGMGKSPLAVALARKYGPAHMLTSQKILQEQYVRDFNDMFLIKGKSNYDCPLHKVRCGSIKCRAPKVICNGMAINRGVDESDIRSLGTSTDCENFEMEEYSPCRKYVFRSRNKSYTIDGCVYKANHVASRIHDITLHNFHSFMYQGILAKSHDPRDFLIIDEAHNIEPIIMDFFEIGLRNELFHGMFPKFSNVKQILQWLNEENVYDWAKDVLRNEYGVSIEKKISSMAEDEEDPVKISSHCSRTDYLRIMKSVLEKESYDESIRYERLVIKIDMFAGYCDNTDFVFETEEKYGKQTLRIKPVYVKFWAPNLFKMGRRQFLMSATILDRDVFCDNLGIDKNDTEFIQMPSEFPVKNRPIYVCSVGKLTRAEKEANLPKIIGIINKIISCDKYKDCKGIIHTHTNDITSFIKSHVNNKRLLFVDDFRGSRDHMLDKHYKSSNSILVAPAMHEGLDLFDDHSRFQIIVKMPYPGMDVQIECRLKKYNDWDWYNCQAALKLIQSYGRSVRHKDDWADTYVLDGSFIDYYNKQTRRFLPKWFIEAIVS